MREDFAGQRVAFDTRGCGRNELRDVKEAEEAEEVKRKTREK
jgi:hypothetical protein